MKVAKEGGIDRWLEVFEERGQLAGLADKKTLSAEVPSGEDGMLPVSERQDYKSAAESLQKIFRPISVEELQGLEFHQSFTRRCKLMNQWKGWVLICNSLEGRHSHLQMARSLIVCSRDTSSRLDGKES